MRLDRLDHFVLTVRSIQETCAFYERMFGMETVTFGEGRIALAFGQQKINLHQAGREWAPRADRPTPGAGDFCLVTCDPIERVLDHLHRLDAVIEEGPVPRTGALGPMTSVYLRDPDGNLVEIASYR